MKLMKVSRLLRNEDGVSLIELAIILPILLILVIGIIEFGFIFNDYIILTGAAREGARVAVAGKVDEIDSRINNHLSGSGVSNIKIVSDLGEQGEVTVITLTGTVSMRTGFFDFLGETIQ